jgi:protein subunit release factor A
MVNYQTDTQIGKGCKFGHLRVTGPNAYKQMKCESGVHKYEFN